MMLNSVYLLHLWQLPCLNKQGPDSRLNLVCSPLYFLPYMPCSHFFTVFDSDHSRLCTPTQNGFRGDRNIYPLPSMWHSGPLQLLVQKPSTVLLTLLLHISWNLFRPQHSHPSGRQLRLPAAGVVDPALCPWLCDPNGYYQMHCHNTPLLKLPLWAQGL